MNLLMATTRIVAINDLARAEHEIAAAWQECQKAEKTGIEFGRIYYQWRERLPAQGNHQKLGFLQLCKKLEIPQATAYYWSNQYEEVMVQNRTIIAPKAPARMNGIRQCTQWLYRPHISTEK